MGQLLYGSARTTAVVRAAIQRSQESLSTLARSHNINRIGGPPKTVVKWRKRTTLTDAPMGPKPASTVLTPEQEAIAVAFREQTLLPRHGGHSMTAYMRCKPLYLSFRAQRCIDVFNVMASVVYPFQTKSKFRKRNSKTILLAICILILPKSIHNKASPICL